MNDIYIYIYTHCISSTISLSDGRAAGPVGFHQLPGPRDLSRGADARGGRFEPGSAAADERRRHGHGNAGALC